MADRLHFESASSDLREKLGMCQWFHYEDHRSVERTITCMRELGLVHLRTGISWADFLRTGGRQWVDWQMQTLHRAGLDILLSIWHTPPSLSLDGTCSAPPRVLKDYADFIDQVIDLYGYAFDAVELWNEPNNRLKWNFRKHDPDWSRFAEMIGYAANWAQTRGKTTVLGGIIPVDPHWLELMRSYGLLEFIDVVAIHGFPEMWWSDAPNWDWYRDWHGWDQKLATVSEQAGNRPIWITETGLATWDMHREVVGRKDLQVRMLQRAIEAPSPRVYWYSVEDLAPYRTAIEGFHVDENEYHMGLVTHTGYRKPAFTWLRNRLARQEVESERARR